MNTACRCLLVASAVLLMGFMGWGGPSSADLSKIYEAPVEKLSCAKVSDAVYRWRFKFTNPTHPADQGEKTQCFITDGTAWTLKLLC